MQVESTEINKMKNTGKGKQQATANTPNTAGSKPKSSNKPSQFSNKVITKDDIMLLSKGKASYALSSIKHSHVGKLNGVDVTNKDDDNLSPTNVILKSVIVDSIPPNESNISDVETVQSQDSDILFSPLYDSFQRDEFYEQEMYNNEDHDDNFLRKFEKYQMVPSSSLSSSSSSPAITSESESFTDLVLPLGLHDEIKDEDFWKEVKATNEDFIPFNNNSDEIRSKRRLSIISQHMANTSMEDFVADDLISTSSTTNNNNNYNYNNIQESTDINQYNIKLLCYRDADGKLALKTTNQLKKSNNLIVSNNNSISNGPTGLVRRKRINKKKKMLKKAIRRKSGVREMISTAVKMNEFML